MPALLRHRLALAAPAQGPFSTFALAARRWSTSSFGEVPDTSPPELFDLREHLDRCRHSRGRLFRMRCLSDSVHRFLAPRFVTTFVTIALLVALFVAL